ncbi:hydroxyethylthiazole kinase [Psychromicrobium silvestre]|uniref:Hydroxyethylthiazole kinase n=1 Tax=Psychromicrobium silvestre TaxID=1645614 RepID=A0A7Y9LUH8_9MICC|nr:hydroxyethylthiazole kinase [Psychromicrobium silvestre]NYE95858.1 hydroxyethylthiazole kinase [Psychromicrobium silvestre]
MTRTPEDLISFTQQALRELRSRTPLVQCITNSVVVNFTANVLLALGAAPAMVDIPGEAGPFTQITSGLLINLGTPNSEHRQAMLEAATAASGTTPWVLDPVAIGSLPIRTPLAKKLRDLGPTIIRGNASEIMALSGEGSGGRGVDSADQVDSALPAALSLTANAQVVAISGAVDVVMDRHEQVRIANGTVLLTQVTGGGCALGAVMAAFASLGADQLANTVAAVTVYTVAAELAAERSAGPGSFAVAFLDALHHLDAETLGSRAHICVEQVSR